VASRDINRMMKAHTAAVILKVMLCRLDGTPGLIIVMLSDVWLRVKRACVPHSQAVRSAEPEDVLHVVNPRRPADYPFCRPDAAAREHVAGHGAV
jgi:hypothetical protein